MTPKARLDSFLAKFTPEMAKSAKPAVAGASSSSPISKKQRPRRPARR